MAFGPTGPEGRGLSIEDVQEMLPRLMKLLRRHGDHSRYDLVSDFIIAPAFSNTIKEVVQETPSHPLKILGNGLEAW